MEVAAVEVRRIRGKVVVIALGRNQQGRRYIKAQKVLDSSKIADKNFKKEMAAAVEEMLGKPA